MSLLVVARKIHAYQQDDAVAALAAVMHLQPNVATQGDRRSNQMQRIAAVDHAEAHGKARQLLDAVQAKLGITPNLMKTLASAPAALEGYLNFGAALGTGRLDAKFREQIALAVAQANSCDYCLSAHTAIGSMVGLKPEEVLHSREAHAQDARRDSGLQFAQALVVQRGEVSDSTFARVRAAGYSDGEITEIVANVAINIFTNYFNHVAQTEVDFPRVSATLPVSEAK
jgi:uncharacterized peroxidase-related enzyme